MNTDFAQNEELQELIKAYERYTREMKRISDQQGHLLQQLLLMYTAAKLEKIDDKSSE